MNTNKTIKYWPEEDKPREKLILKGIDSLTDAELLAILLGTGYQNMNAVDLAREILKEYKDFNELGKVSVQDLQKFKGIGEAKAITIISALEIGKRRMYQGVNEKQQFSSPDDVFSYMYSVLNDLKYEEFWVIYLNNANKILKRQKIAQGGINQTTVDIRLILKSAIENLSVSIILCHNHPSGNLLISDADLNLTKKIVDAAKTIDIKVIDHLIIGNNKYISFKNEGYL